MTVTQLSVTIPNVPGKALDVLGALARAKVDVRAISVADTADVGLVRLVVDNVTKAKKVLNRKGLNVSTAQVIAVVAHDRPGALVRMLEPLAKRKINVEYLYGTTCACSEDSCGCGPEGCDNIIILRVRDAKKAEAVLRAAKFRIAKP
jgi:hypothetical protein